MAKGFLYLCIHLFALLLLPFLALSSSFFVEEGEEPLLKVYHHREEGVMELLLEEYLRGVVAGEMPASFPLEALKAQAVLSRTYALSRYAAMSEERGAHITTDSSIHQAWRSTEELLNLWGPMDFLSNLFKIGVAVDSTRGEVLTFEGNLIEALYHANAGGKTEDPIYIWARSLPYLKSIKSPWDELAPRFSQVHLFCLEELTERLGQNLSSSNDLAVVDWSPSGRVQEILVGGERFSGADFRASLALPSTFFTIEGEGSNVIIETKGHGHGVGMSQYGARGMAEEGYTYQEILKYYYQGVQLMRVDY